MYTRSGCPSAANCQADAASSPHTGASPSLGAPSFKPASLRYDRQRIRRRGRQKRSPLVAQQLQPANRDTSTERALPLSQHHQLCFAPGLRRAVADARPLGDGPRLTSSEGRWLDDRLSNDPRRRERVASFRAKYGQWRLAGRTQNGCAVDAGASASCGLGSPPRLWLGPWRGTRRDRQNWCAKRRQVI